MDSSTGIQHEGMLTSKVDCFSCLKTKVSINLQHCRSKNETKQNPKWRYRRLIVVVFYLKTKGQPSKWKTINLRCRKEAENENEKRRQASQIGMSMSKVDCCFLFCLKTNASINLRRCQSKNEKWSCIQNEGVEGWLLLFFVGKQRGNYQKGKTINLRRGKRKTSTGIQIGMLTSKVDFFVWKRRQST